MARGAESYQFLPLLPFRFRFAGYIMIFLGIGAAYLYFFGGRPTYFEIPVFAIVTSYAETRWFVFAQTNALDELAFVFSLLGLLAILFSKEKHELPEISFLRIKAIIYGVYGTSLFLILLYITVFGWPIFIAIACAFAFFMVLSIIIFRVLVYKYQKEYNNSSNTKEGAL
ncbi:MAG: hypothetical protein U5K72_00700 [Balneolaceae bacterium]|nr:hypothetical protein [Balneolaceae bacterium]